MKMDSSRLKRLNRLQIISVFVFVFGFIFQLTLQNLMQPYVIDGYLFQVWSSEDFMHTVPIEELRSSPFETLTNIHIQPPGLDFLRAFFVQFYDAHEIHQALKGVDLSLYALWVFLYGLVGVIVFNWLAKFVNLWMSLVLSLIFLFHPALIFYTTLLDTTLLSSLLVLLMYYFLWKIYKEGGSIFPLTASVILLFFFRSIFQLPFVFILGISMFFLRIDLKKIKIFFAITLITCGSYTIKQKIQFDLLSTSSFVGINLVRSINVKEYRYPYPIDFVSIKEESLPAVLTQQRKMNGETNYNHLQYLEFNKTLTEEYKQYLFEFHPKAMFYSYARNIKIYFRPSSTYTEHIIVDRLPWRTVYDKIFSAPILPILLILSLLFYSVFFLKRNSFVESLAFLLPGLYIFLISILFEAGENHRFKFFLEPVFFIFISTQIYYLYNRFHLLTGKHFVS